jgi:hypothetical protein
MYAPFDFRLVISITLPQKKEATNQHCFSRTIRKNSCQFKADLDQAAGCGFSLAVADQPLGLRVWLRA